MTRLFKFVLLILSVISLLQAKTFKGEVESFGNVGCQTLTKKESPYVSSICVEKVKVKYKLYSFMGEPVEVYAVYWELSPYINLRSGTQLVALMPQEVQDAYAKVSLSYKSKFVISLNHANMHRAYFRFSGGALKGSKKGYSFDTPGSPSWDKYMLKNSYGNEYYSKKDAINIFKSIPEQSAYVRFEKIEELGFSNLFDLNKALKPKKEKPKKKIDQVKDPKTKKTQNKKESSTKQQQEKLTDQTQQSQTVSPNMMNTFNHTPAQAQIQQNTAQQTSGSIQTSSNAQTFTQSSNYTLPGTVNASLLLLIDVSGSMAGAKLKSAKKAALESIDTSLKKGVEIAILAFSGSCGSPISKRIDFTTDKQRLHHFVNSLSSGGGTPLGNALKIANNYLYKSKSSSSQTQMIILLADGDDNCGNISSVMATLRSQGIIFRHQTIGLEVKSNSSAARQLQTIAKDSGGVYHHVKDHKQLPNIFKEALGTMEILEMLGTFGTQQNTNNQKKHNPSSTQMLLNDF
jgi:Mg-chelatase subunit ChlD